MTYIPAAIPSNPRPTPPRVTLSAPPLTPARPRPVAQPTLYRLDVSTVVHESTVTITIHYPAGRKSDALAALTKAVNDITAQVRR